jgi:branched-chain amino acid transport system substrate-binding protein
MKRSCVLFLVSLLVVSLTCIAYAAKEVEFGVVTPLSGGMALYGTNVWRGVQIACEEINARGGVAVAGEKYLLKPIVFDDETKPDKALAGAKRIISMQKVPMIYTPASYSGFPMMGINEKDPPFILMVPSQSPPFTEKGNKLVVRTCNNVKKTMKPWVSFILRSLEKRNLTVNNAGVMIVNTELGRYWANEFVKAWEGAGKAVVDKFTYSTEETDYYPQLTPLLAKKPQMIVMTSVAESSARVIKQARQLGYKGVFLNSIAGDLGQLSSLVPAEQLEGTFVEVGRWNYKEPPVLEFIKKCQAKWGEEPQYSAGQAYDSIQFFARGLEIAGTTTDVYKIRAALPKALPIPNSLFKLSDLEEDGDIMMPVFLVEFKGGKILPVKD